MEMRSQINMQKLHHPFKIELITRDGYELPLPTYTRSYSFSSNLMCSDQSTIDEELVLLTEGMIQTQMERNRSSWMIAKSLFDYIIASFFKMRKTFNVGVMAVVLGVSFIAIISSLLEIAPVAFLSIT